MMKSARILLVAVSVFVAALYAGCATTGKEAGTKGTTAPRAFEGAPPLVPHDVEVDMSCLDCHRNGENDAVITSHPDRFNCVQCHIPNVKGVEPFVESTF
ncbi:MAG: nitrate reductase cytochrome c-type subunit [Nitrospirota bacterium]|nr:nitrate reductase cytochrome c-type subunit [Nitrospirota bacterium]